MNDLWNKEDTIIIMGNGPSLKEEYFDILRDLDVHTIGLNAAYRYWRLIDWYPTYYCCFDYAVTLSHKDEISKMILDENIPIESYVLLEKPTPKSLLNPKIRYFSDEIRNHPKYFEKKHNKDFFGRSGDPDNGKHPQKFTSTGCGAVRVAIEMGYKNIILIGMDGNYPVQQLPKVKNETGCRVKLMETPEKNPNYFWDDYQQKGDLYHRPGSHLGAWKELIKDVKEHGINVINCSEGSKINVFPMAKFEDVIENLV